MSSTLSRRLVWGCLGVFRLPSLAPPVVDAEAEARFAVAADALLAGESVAVPEPRLDFLRWLAEHRDAVFHGSPRDDLQELSTERRSHDTTAWGNQQAVYASIDPVWAIYFACLRRDRGWTGTRNASLGRAGGPLYPRRYSFVHNRGSASPDRFGPGSLYLLSPHGFVSDEPLADAIEKLVPVQFLAADRQPAFVDARDQQQVLGEPRQAFRLLRGRPDGGRVLVAAPWTAERELELGAEQCERRA